MPGESKAPSRSTVPAVVRRVAPIVVRHRAFRVFLLAVFAFFWMPISQCAWLNFIDPWFTQTMVERALQDGWPESDDIDLDDLPRQVPLQFVSAEDQHFFEHNGFDWTSIQLAWDHYWGRTENAPIRGASTISQQVSRNVFLWQKRSWLRKGLEAWYTIWLELLVPKERILEVYLNVAETGPHQFGVEAAAQHWYKKPAKELSANEAATIASLLPAPRSRVPTAAKSKKRAAWIVKHPAPWRGEKAKKPVKR